MRIVSYNVRYFGHALKGLASTAASKMGIARALSSLREQPDLICLQEVEQRSMRSGIVHRGSHGHESQLQAFMRHLGEGQRGEGLKTPYQAWYFPAHTYGLGKVKVYTTGLAVLVNTDRLSVLADNQGEPKHVTHYGGRLKQKRIVAHLHLEDTRGKRLHVFNTHLSLPSVLSKDFWSRKTKMGFGANQLLEAKALSEYLQHRAAGEPYVVGGDFNSAPGSPVYRYLTEEAKLSGAQAELKQIDPRDPRGYSTAGFLNLRMHLDHLFGAGVIWHDLDGTAPFGDPAGRFHGLSDHVPLIARFDL